MSGLIVEGCHWLLATKQPAAGTEVAGELATFSILLLVAARHGFKNPRHLRHCEDTPILT